MRDDRLPYDRLQHHELQRRDVQHDVVLTDRLLAELVLDQQLLQLLQRVRVQQHELLAVRDVRRRLRHRELLDELDGLGQRRRGDAVTELA